MLRAARAMERERPTESAPAAAAATATTVAATAPLIAPAATVGSPSVVSAAATATAIVEIDVTPLLSGEGAPNRLLASVAVRLMQALRHHGVVAAAAVPDLEVDGRVIGRGGDLTVQAMLRMLTQDARTASPGPAGSTRVTVQSTSAQSVVLLIPALAPGGLCAVGVGTVVERPVVVRMPGRDALVGVGSMVQLSFTHDARVIDPATAAACLTTLGRLVADPDLVREFAG
ncbi:MAG: 2-oxo acid dehydrogenase subunit E2 [Actinocrinis sp.]